MNSRDSVSGRQTFVRWWRRFWTGALVLVLVTTGVVYLVSAGNGERGDPGDAAAIPLTVGAATCAFLVLLWAVVCSVGFARERRSLST